MDQGWLSLSHPFVLSGANRWHFDTRFRRILRGSCPELETFADSRGHLIGKQTKSFKTLLGCGVVHEHIGNTKPHHRQLKLGFLEGFNHC